MVELVDPAELAPLVVVEALDANALTGGESVLAEGVYSAVDVSALEPADVEPTEEVEEAAAPLAPCEELLWMYKWFSMLGSC